MLGHMVYFTLKERTPEAIDKLVQDCRTYLTGHPGLVFFAAGTLVPDLTRPVNQTDFDVALHTVFESRAVARSGPVWELPRKDGFVLPQARADGEPASYDAFAEATRTNALLVIRDGAIVFEAYRNRMGPATRHIGFSMTKTITAMLVGQALARGEIASLDDRADKYVPELAGGGYGGPTAYFLIQLVGMLFERSRFSKRFRGRVLTWICLIAPAYWLFPPAFTTGIVVPFIRFLGDAI